MSADCVQDILHGFLNRTDPTTQESFVHRGTIADLHADFTAEGWFSGPYSLATVERSLTEIHQAASTNDVFVNYVGPGQHITATPLRNKKGIPYTVLTSAIDVVPDTEWSTTDGLMEGVVARHRKTGDEFYIAGDIRDPRNAGRVYMMHVFDGGERWLCTRNGTGHSPAQRLRMLQGNLEWLRYVDTLIEGMSQQFDIQVDAEMLQPITGRANARTLGTVGANQRTMGTLAASNVTLLETRVIAFKPEVPWACPLFV